MVKYQRILEEYRVRCLGRGEVERVPWKCARQEELTRVSPTLPFLFASSKLSSDTFYTDTQKFILGIPQSANSDHFPFTSLVIRKIKENKMNLQKEGSY